MESVKCPKTVFFRKIAGFSNQHFIHREPVKPHPIPLEFPAAPFKQATGYVAAAGFSRERGARFNVGDNAGRNEIRTGKPAPHKIAPCLLSIEFDQRGGIKIENQPRPSDTISESVFSPGGAFTGLVAPRGLPPSPS